MARQVRLSPHHDVWGAPSAAVEETGCLSLVASTGKPPPGWQVCAIPKLLWPCILLKLSASLVHSSDASFGPQQCHRQCAQRAERGF